MPRHAFKMFLNPGAAHEYRRRHDAIWPELAALLKAKGVANYSICNPALVSAPSKKSFSSASSPTFA